MLKSNLIKNKGELKAKLRSRIMFYNPELEIKDTTWDRLFHYYEGYVDCFDSVVKFPVEDSFAQDFIIDETFKHLLKIC